MSGLSKPGGGPKWKLNPVGRVYRTYGIWETFGDEGVDQGDASTLQRGHLGTFPPKDAAGGLGVTFGCLLFR